MVSDRGVNMRRATLAFLAAGLLAACGPEDQTGEAEIGLVDLTSAGTLDRKLPAPVVKTPTALDLPGRELDARSKPIPLPMSPQDPIQISLEDDAPDAGSAPAPDRPQKRRKVDPEDLETESNAERHKR